MNATKIIKETHKLSDIIRIIYHGSDDADFNQEKDNLSWKAACAAQEVLKGALVEQLIAKQSLLEGERLKFRKKIIAATKEAFGHKMFKIQINLSGAEDYPFIVRFIGEYSGDISRADREENVIQKVFQHLSQEDANKILRCSVTNSAEYRKIKKNVT